MVRLCPNRPRERGERFCIGDGECAGIGFPVVFQGGDPPKGEAGLLPINRRSRETVTGRGPGKSLARA